MKDLGLNGECVRILISSILRKSPLNPCPTSTRVFGIVSESGLVMLLRSQEHMSIEVHSIWICPIDYLMIACIIWGNLTLEDSWLSPNCQEPVSGVDRAGKCWAYSILRDLSIISAISTRVKEDSNSPPKGSLAGACCELYPHIQSRHSDLVYIDR